MLVRMERWECGPEAREAATERFENGPAPSLACPEEPGC